MSSLLCIRYDRILRQHWILEIWFQIFGEKWWSIWVDWVALCTGVWNGHYSRSGYIIFSRRFYSSKITVLHELHIGLPNTRLSFFDFFALCDRQQTSTTSIGLVYSSLRSLPHRCPFIERDSTCLARYMLSFVRLSLCPSHGWSYKNGWS